MSGASFFPLKSASLRASFILNDCHFLMSGPYIFKIEFCVLILTLESYIYQLGWPSPTYHPQHSLVEYRPSNPIGGSFPKLCRICRLCSLHLRFAIVSYIDAEKHSEIFPVSNITLYVFHTCIILFASAQYKQDQVTWPLWSKIKSSVIITSVVHRRLLYLDKLQPWWPEVPNLWKCDIKATHVPSSKVMIQSFHTCQYN